MLRYAAYHGHLNDINFILRISRWFKVDINAQGPSTLKTALHQCVERGHDVCARALLGENARKDLPDSSNKTAQYYIENSTNPKIRELLTVSAAPQALASV